MRISNNRNEPIIHVWVFSVGEVCPEQIIMPVCKFKQNQITKIETNLQDLYLRDSFKHVKHVCVDMVDDICPKRTYNAIAVCKSKTGDTDIIISIFVPDIAESFKDQTLSIQMCVKAFDRVLNKDVRLVPLYYYGYVYSSDDYGQYKFSA
ncbi:hypothetical protein PFISCL1PPCAC_26385 [Pristionchus fissidentatus]|uniref:Uncharacterized protein n=1 Tax=Pristionchus fissidentatus TaxID=1538716 RepID=A0AAV5WUU3_9BILA|nr:hypothetical protein PFISCL1PPCAC_26385 [Pristionchus fissidentatus]